MAFATDVRTTIDMCRHCFMCRHANPTFLVTKLDAHTPRGYALALSRIDDGLAGWSEDAATKLYQSTLDGLCSELCEFHWREDLVVQAGRAEAVRQGYAPASAARAAERRQTHASKLPAGIDVAPERLDREGAEILFISGIDARERAPETIAATVAILDALERDWTVSSVESDPGIDLWELGYEREAAVAAERFADAVGRLGPARIVTGSSRVLRALRQPLQEVLGQLPRAEHLSEFLAGRVRTPGGGAPGAAERRQVVYHDPCSLGRRSRVFDAPRQLIAEVTGTQPVEFAHSREVAECCGEGGVLPELDPRLAARLASAQLARTPEGVDTLVTACPGCRSLLGTVAADERAPVQVLDISELTADALGLAPRQRPAP